MQRPQPETVTLEDIVITEELSWRNSRRANLLAENQALHALARQLVSQSQTILQNLVDIALELCSAGTAGVSLLEITPTGEEIFRWNVLAGGLAQYVGGTTKRNFSPCGTCLDRGTPQLYSYPDRYFTYLQAANTPIVEGLVLPLIADKHALGTIWILSHNEQRHFDSEDVRVMTSLADFVAAALLLNQRQTQELLAKNVQLEAEVAERKRAEELARESEAYFHAIANFVPDLLWRNDLDGKAIWYNKRWLDYTGQTMEEAQGDGWLEAIHPSDRAACFANFHHAVKECRPLRQEHRIKGKDGNYRWFLVQTQPVIQPDGHIISFGAGTDIHDRQTTLEKLRSSEQLLQAMIENLPGGAAFVVDRNLRYLLAEGEALHTAGFQSADLVGKTIFEVLPAELAANYEVNYRIALAGETFEYEHNAHNRTYISRGTPLRAENGEIYAVLAVSYDITERKQAEIALHESEEKFRTFVSAASDIIYEMSADWREMRFLKGKEFITTTENPRRDWMEEYILETDKPQVWAAINRAIATRSNFELEHRVIRLDGTVGWTFSRAIPLFDETGEIIKWFGAARDITDRQRREEQQKYLLKLSDALRPLESAIEIQNTATRILGEYLQVDRVFYVDVEDDKEHCVIADSYVRQGTTRLEGRGRIDDFGWVSEELLSGKTMSIADVNTDVNLSQLTRESFLAIDVMAVLAVPLIKEGQWAVTFALHHLSPRQWSEAEIRLAQETAERTWAAVERAKAEQRLRTSEAKYRSLFNSMDEGYILSEVIFDENDKPIDILYLEANPAAKRLAGRDFSGRRMREIDLHYEEYWYEIYGRVALTGEAVRDERYAEPHGRWFDFYTFKVGRRESHRVATVFQDITDRKRTEEQQKYLLKLSDALRSLTDPVEIQAVAARLLGEHLSANQVHYGETIGDYVVIQQGYGNGLPPMVGNFRFINFGERLIADYRAGRTTVSYDVHSDPNITEAERRTIAEAGFQAYIAVPLTKAEGWVATLAVHSIAPRDWTTHEVELVEETAERTWAAVERARAETALRESEIRRVREQAAREEERQRAEALAELDRAKTRFFSNVSHEFRTPLTLLLAPLSDALSDSANPLPPAQLERLELAHRNSLRLLKLVNTVLDFSRIEAGRIEAVYEPTDLALHTTHLASVFRSAIERAGLRLVVDCPPLAEPVYVDREMWEKIVLNLLSNAFKFTLEGEIAVRLHLADDQHVRLQVEDTGTGIEPEELPHLFERFYQVRKPTARTHEGSGIGLALVQELIKMHGGTVQVSSTVGQGSCFTVTIPLGTAHLPTERIQATRTLISTALAAAPYVQEAQRWIGEESVGGVNSYLSSHPSHPSPSSPSHILIVDDNADMRDYLTQILSEHVEVQAVADGAAALAAVNERVPDLVLTDVMMPGLDGFELLKVLRADARTKEVPIILLSARAGEESVIKGLLAGADDYLIKPFRATELVTRVNAYLKLAHLRSETLRQERIINHRKDEVLSTVSHELNTPLVAILGWTRLLRSSPQSPAMLMKSLETIERNATLQAKLVQDLLDISRITAGKIHLNLEPVQLQGVIENAIATLHQSHQTKDIRLDCLLDPLPTIVQGDPERLQQIVLNLLTNAVKFTTTGGRIEVSLQTHENQAQISITDTGCGIDSDFLPYIFDTFSQADGVKKGLGLGLAIARSLVELHCGTIHAYSPGIGQGATFIVKFSLR